MNIDTTATRLVSKYMPVPAVITEDGYLEYYYYKDLTSAYEGEDKKLAVIKKILLLDLIDRYKISDDKSTDEILSIIKQRFENDREINLHQNSLEDYLKNGIDSNKIKFLTD